MITRSSGFTLIELLVVVAILGIIAAVGLTAYSGYVRSSKIKTAENTLYQVALAQTEFFTDNRIFKVDADVNCPADIDTSVEIETVLLGGTGSITEMGVGGRQPKFDFNFCVDDVDDFEITAEATDESNLDCDIVLNSNNELDKADC